MSGCIPRKLTCEFLASPRGLNTETPRFSWALGGERENSRQSAYRITVGEGAGLWDSGRVASAETRLIPYGGAPLPKADALAWSVEVWDEDGQGSGPVEGGTIYTGLPEAGDWQAEWIARYFVLPDGRDPPADNLYDNRWQARPADYLRRPFRLDRPVRRALVHASALGAYHLSINGSRVGDDVLAPGWTDYHQRVPYQVHDVTALLAAGDNVIGAILGEGWYCGRVGFNQRKAGMHYGGRPALICQLEFLFADGSRECLLSDGTWRTSQGPIFHSDFLMGERYDARHEMPGWDSPGFDDSAWQPVEAFVPEPRPPHLDAERCPPVRETMEVPARLIGDAPGGRFIYDTGQNLAGYVRLAVDVPDLPAGAVFTLRHGERLADDGSLYVANLRNAVATDVFVARGGRREVFKPHFTFHGFQYVELTLPDGVRPEEVVLTAIAIHNDLPMAGGFECGNDLVNRLVSNIAWSQRGNFLSVPTDCPQRDERLGWLADAQVFWRTAGYTMDVAAFTAKWMVDIADAQLADGAFTDIAPSKPLNPYRQQGQPGAPGWGDGAVIMAWEHHLRYDDRDLLDAMFPRLEAWMDHIAAANPDLVRRHAVYNNYGDWLSVGPASDRAVVATAYWARIADLMARIATVLGKRTVAAGYRRLGGEIRDAFRLAFVDAEGRISSDTQTVYLLALDFDVAPEQRQAFAGHLLRRLSDAGGHLQTGFLGVRHLCPVLADIGAVKEAYQLLLNEDYPSWGFSIRHGATTIWERWDGWTPERGFQSANMNSFNHYAYGAVGEWLYARVAGIDWDEETPGFRSIRFRPLFDRRIGWCRASYDGPTGMIESNWAMSNERIAWSIAVPPNCAGTVELPYAPAAITLDNAALPPAASMGVDRPVTRFVVGAGRHDLAIDVA